MKIIAFKPDVRLIQMASVILVLGLLVSIWPDVVLPEYWLIVSIVLGLFALFELWRVYFTPVLTVRRMLAQSVSVGLNHEIKLTVKNNSSRSLMVDIYDHFPENADIQGLPRRLLLDANEVAELSYFFTPLSRGLMYFHQIEYLVHSPLLFWTYKRILRLENKVRVYPNYVPIMQYALLATENHLSMMGILKHRRRGQGSDFHQLREFREGDSLRQIDWKASSRARKTIAREYQEERDQKIIIMMDCGQRMLAKDGILSHFDHSLNALLLLAYVALKQGDAVGVSTFSHEQPLWIKAVKGVTNLNVLLNGIYDLQPGVAAPDYSSAARNLILRQRKRALVIVITNLRDDDSDDLINATQLLKKYHKVVVAGLLESGQVDYLNQQVTNLQDALTVSAIHGYQLRRHLLVKQLRARGIEILDVLPENLALALTNSYLDLKSSGKI